ncbi:MAG: hypothetical protein UU26_C0041G0003 [Candidatus Daviesbacteria bacterium GW2011_GWC1_40_9]|nr:MAG: hypothetical protein UU26_C0041G0003 [Candidatus Daviesbacteria bacterium GW2011_GWC1_40_9]
MDDQNLQLPKIEGNMLEKSKKILIGGGILAVLLGLAVVLAPLAGNLFRSQEEPVVVTAPPSSSASYILLATSSAIPAGSEFNVSVVVKSETEEANLFVARLKFPTDILEVSSINLKPTGGDGFISDWFIANWVENFFDNSDGSVSLVGGVPDPGFKTLLGGEGALMAQILFKAKKTGSAAISFDDTSAIYRNLDNANILVTKQELALTIGGAVPTPIFTIKGDINGDGIVDLIDLSALLSRFGQTSPGERADLNLDSHVNSIDFSILVKILLEKEVIEESSQSGELKL